MIVARFTPGSRLGNKMMQYASLYALSRRLDFRLALSPIRIFPRTSPTLSKGQVFRTPTPHYRLKARHFINYEEIAPSLQRTIVNHEGCYLENIYNFHHARDELVKIFSLTHPRLNEYACFVKRGDTLKPIIISHISPRDIVISLRLGDFLHKRKVGYRWKKCVYTRFLGLDYFDIILKNLRFGRLFITSDEPFHPLVNAFQAYDPIMVKNDNPGKTMSFIGRFDRIAISESTYSWWSAYLSNATEIYFPISKTGLWGINVRWDCASSSWMMINRINARDRDLYLRVNDDRYKYVHQESGVIWKYGDAPGRRSTEDFKRVAPHC